MNKKDLGVIFGLFGAIALLIIFGRGFTSLSTLTPRGEATQGAQSNSSIVDIKIKNLVLKAEIADDSNKKKVGLSKKDSLAQNSGLLFVFEKEEKQIFWMKDMKFPIDIFWINRDKKIVMIAKNVPVETGKKDRELIRYSADAIYVLEVNAGIAELNDITIGDAVEFQL